MIKSVQNVMTSGVATLPTDATITEAASMMRDRNVGDIVVTEDERICGIITDRDIVVRALAGASTLNIRLGEICSRHLATLETTNTVDEAIALMRDRAVRRLPVVENERPVGIVSLGDLAEERDPHSVLGTMSAARPNN